MKPLGCRRCAGATAPGFVCEEHPDWPWEHGGCGAAGAPCPGCNPDGRVEFARLIATTEPERDGEPPPVH